MNRISIGRVVRATIAVVLLVIASSVVALSAQGSNPLGQVLEKLDEIIGTLTPPAGIVTLASPPVFLSAPNQDLACTLANLGTENVEGVQRVIDGAGTVTELPLLVEPGHSDGVFAIEPGFSRCEFRFEGTAASVRAILQVIVDGGVVAIVEMR